jgi:hypothetical protein
MVAVFAVDGEGDGGGLVSSTPGSEANANLTRFTFATPRAGMTRVPTFTHVSEGRLDIMSCPFSIISCPLQLAFSCLVSGARVQSQQHL